MATKRGPWRLGRGYWICKGARVVMECDGATTADERQSIVDSLNRDYDESAADSAVLSRVGQAQDAAHRQLFDGKDGGR